MKDTQCQRLLEAFEAKGELYVYEIMAPRPMGLGIAQYNARIKELRESGHQIINTQPGHFVYKTDTAERKQDMQALDGYAKFEAMGKFLKGKTEKPVNPYESMTTQELEALKAKAEAWLEGNFDHPKYAEALKRFEHICDALINLTLTGE